MSVEVEVCEICGCIIASYLMKTHESWHERLRNQAFDWRFLD